MRQAKPTLPKLTPVSRETAQKRVYRELRDALMRGRFVPGAAVTLRRLAFLNGPEDALDRDAAAPRGHDAW